MLQPAAAFWQCYILHIDICIYNIYIYTRTQTSANVLHPHVSYLHRIHRCFLKPCGIFESNHPSSPRKREARMFNVEKRRLRALTGQRNMRGEITCWLSVVDRWIQHTKIVQLNQSRHRTNTCVRVLGVTSALYKIWGEDGEDADASEVKVDWNLQTYNGLSSCVSGLL